MPVTRRDFVRNVFVASQAALAGQLMTHPVYAGDNPPGGLNFAIIGDWGRRGRPDQVEVAQQMGAACKNANAAFVISVGDNFYEDGVASLDDNHWQKSFEEVYTAPSLQVPWYVILGNHDYRGKSAVQLEYAKSHPRWIMPARYYSKVYAIDAATKLECFYLDTTPMISDYKHDIAMTDVHGQQVVPQLVWLDQALAASKAQWKLVFGHHPIYSTGGVHGNQPDVIQNVLPILQKYKVPAYFAGHDHDLQHLQTDTMDFFISGGGSEHRPLNPFLSGPVKFGQGISGFAMASVRANEMEVRFIDNSGNQIYSAKVTRPI